ncbi:MAG: hypothetical protein R2755_02555 [Acidimicrobiales bacterium]
MTTLASKDPEVFIAMTFAAYCTQSMVEAANNRKLKESGHLPVPAVGVQRRNYAGKEKFGGDGMAADGWYMVGGGLKALDCPPSTAIRSRCTPRGPGRRGHRFQGPAHVAAGVSFTWTLDQALQVASRMEGLNRANLRIIACGASR